MALVQEEHDELRRLVESVRDYYKKPGNFDLNELVTERIRPVLKSELERLTAIIEIKHKIDIPDNNYLITQYTSVEALVSILESAHKKPSNQLRHACIRMYDSAHFNDPEEGSLFVKNLQNHYSWLEDIKVRHAYIASFVYTSDTNSAGDELLFWRTYGQEGEGCSLSMIPPKRGLVKVLYEPSDLTNTVDTLNPLLELLNPLLDISNTSMRKEVQVTLSECIWKSLERICYLYKNKAYSYENECRFIVLDSEIDDRTQIHIEYRNTSDSPPQLRHYYEHKDLQIDNLLTSRSSITLGPCVAYRDDVRHCIEILRDRADLRQKTEIRISGISYRKS